MVSDLVLKERRSTLVVSPIVKNYLPNDCRSINHKAKVLSMSGKFLLHQENLGNGKTTIKQWQGLSVIFVMFTSVSSTLDLYWKKDIDLHEYIGGCYNFRSERVGPPLLLWWKRYICNGKSENRKRSVPRTLYLYVPTSNFIYSTKPWLSSSLRLRT